MGVHVDRPRGRNILSRTNSDKKLMTMTVLWSQVSTMHLGCPRKKRREERTRASVVGYDWEGRRIRVDKHR